MRYNIFNAVTHMDPEWRAQLNAEFGARYFEALTLKLMEEAYPVYPPQPSLFRALALCPFKAVRVVILGQDPYHGEGQANGLAFSVNKGVTLPPSLLNIFKEIQTDVNVTPEHGDLTRWARQGVLLLNTSLTVRQSSPGSHSAWGWSAFTDAVIRAIVANLEGVGFLLWGRHAQEKERLVTSNHYVLKAAHPSPLSAYNGFFGCRHFSAVNKILQNMDGHPIDWRT